MSKSIKFLPSTILIFFSLFFNGCSSNGGVNKVAGAITLDGKSVSQAQLTFYRYDGQKTLAAANLSVESDASGKFTIQSNQGVVIKPGNYLVIATKFVDKSGKVPNPAEDGMDLEQLRASGTLRNILPTKYAERETSDLKVTIGASGNDNLEIKLTSK